MIPPALTTPGAPPPPRDKVPDCRTCGLAVHRHSGNLCAICGQPVEHHDTVRPNDTTPLRFTE